MKKIFFIFSLLILGSFGNAAFASSFSDVSSGHENYNAISYLKEKGIINGFADGTFKPENKLNRAEAIKVIIEAFDYASVTYSGGFSDVKAGDWFSSYVASGKKEGIINGYSDGSFKPGNTLLLAEALKIVLVGAKASVPSSVDKDVFSDVRVSDWFSVYAYFARENNIILGDDYGKISPASEITRGEFAEIIFRMMKVSELSKPFDLSTSWPMYLSELGFSMKYNAPRWKVSADKSSVTFYNPDLAYGELSASKVFSNSARIYISVDKNVSKKSASDYFSALKTNFPTYTATEFQFKNMSALELSNPSNRMIDLYIYTSGGPVIGAFTEYGSGILAFQYPREISAMLSSIEIGGGVSGGGSKEQILSAIYSNILIENKGMASLSTLPDKSIIETDTIGVGTGPVDYYYCSEFDITFKYERESDLILDKREGKTSAF
jgi:hypothetical protein